MKSKILSVAIAAGLLCGTSIVGFAQSSAQQSAPGQRMQDKGSAPGEPGASGYVPGHEMQDKGSKSGQPGASGYAPGRQDTTGQSDRGGTQNPDGKMGTQPRSNAR
jgi:hypothetical protein